MPGPLAFVIEDDPEIARLYSLVLKEIPFEVETVATGPEALARLSDVVPYLVILDLNLPDVSGVEVLHRIRGDMRLAGIKVIIVSANPHMINQSYEEADLVLQKPVSYTQLRDLVRRFA